MSRPCSVCVHPQKRQIDKALVSGHVLSHLATTYEVSTSALSRHRRLHLSALLKKAYQIQESAEGSEIVQQRKAAEAAEAAHVLDMRQQLKAINGACLDVLKKAHAEAKPSTLLQAVDRIHRQIALQARLLGEPTDAESDSDAIHNQWPVIRQVILDALRPFPEAKVAVAEALSTLSDATS